VATYAVRIADRSNATVEDITSIAFDLVVSPRKNRPSSSRCRVPTHLLGGGNTLRTGDRRLIVTRNGAVVANDILWVKEATGDANTGYADIVGLGPMVRWQRRWLQDADGQIFDGVSSDGADRGLDFPAGGLADPEMPASGGLLLKEAIDNTIANDGEIGVVTSGGTFSLSSPPAPNVRFLLRNITPITVGDFATMLFDSGAVDAVIQPTAPGGSSTQGILSAVTAAGVDRSGVHFQYNTGSRNCSHASIVESMDEFANKIWYELGTREGSHFRNNVTIDAPGVTVDDSGSRSQYGVYHDIPIHDEFSGKIPTRLPAYEGEEKPYTGDINPLYEAYVRLYNAELAYRIKPRKIIKVTPQAGMGLSPWDDFQLGDTVRVSIVGLGDDILNATVRIHGWNAMPDNDSGAERYELMLVSDDE
jgi:hypothetical protein